jgi:hypoxanthine phosphoribosyltransferase
MNATATRDAAQFRVLIPEDRLQARIQELGQQIRKDFGDRPITCICVLKGSFIFMADLVRAIGGELETEFLGVSSYQGGTQTTGVVQITKDLSGPIEEKDVIIIEDIIDTGLTMHYLLEMLAVRQPRTLAVCTLLDKPRNREVEMKADYVGFSIPDEFVVGYGLDLAERYRNLPHIAVYTP